MHDLAHVAEWEPYIMHDPAHGSWVGSVLFSVDIDEIGYDEKNHLFVS